jgi:DNA-binding CsgD family transcriptional regulator
LSGQEQQALNFVRQNHAPVLDQIWQKWPREARNELVNDILEDVETHLATHKDQLQPALLHDDITRTISRLDRSQNDKVMMHDTLEEWAHILHGFQLDPVKAKTDLPVILPFADKVKEALKRYAEQRQRFPAEDPEKAIKRVINSLDDNSEVLRAVKDVLNHVLDEMNAQSLNHMLPSLAAKAALNRQGFTEDKLLEFFEDLHNSDPEKAGRWRDLVDEAAFRSISIENVDELSQRLRWPSEKITDTLNFVKNTARKHGLRDDPTLLAEAFHLMAIADRYDEIINGVEEREDEGPNRLSEPEYYVFELLTEGKTLAEIHQIMEEKYKGKRDHSLAAIWHSLSEKLDIPKTRTASTEGKSKFFREALTKVIWLGLIGNNYQGLPQIVADQLDDVQLDIFDMIAEGVRIKEIPSLLKHNFSREEIRQSLEKIVDDPEKLTILARENATTINAFVGDILRKIAKTLPQFEGQDKVKLYQAIGLAYRAPDPNRLDDLIERETERILSQSYPDLLLADVFSPEILRLSNKQKTFLAQITPDQRAYIRALTDGIPLTAINSEVLPHVNKNDYIQIRQSVLRGLDVEKPHEAVARAWQLKKFFDLYEAKTPVQLDKKLDPLDMLVLQKLAGDLDPMLEPIVENMSDRTFNAHVHNINSSLGLQQKADMRHAAVSRYYQGRLGDNPDNLTYPLYPLPTPSGEVLILTEQQQKTLVMRLEGKSLQETAQALQTTNVSGHINGVKKKLGFNTSSEMIAYLEKINWPPSPRHKMGR